MMAVKTDDGEADEDDGNVEETDESHDATGHMATSSMVTCVSGGSTVGVAAVVTARQISRATHGHSGILTDTHGHSRTLTDTWTLVDTH